MTHASLIWFLSGVSFLSRRSFGGICAEISWVNVAAIKNGRSVKSDTDSELVPAMLSRRTLLPLRFVAQAPRLHAQGDETKKVITISYTSQ